MKRQPVTKDRAYYESLFRNARIWLLVATVFTVLNILFVVLGSSTILTFCAIGPVYLISEAVLGLQDPEYFQFLASSLGIDLADKSLATPIAVIMIAVAVLGILAYFFSWICSKKDGRWMTVALVLFILDTVFMVAYQVFFYRLAKALEVSYSFDGIAIVFHCWVLFDTILGVVAWHKLKKMPEETVEGTFAESAEAEPMTETAEAEPTAGEPAPTAEAPMPEAEPDPLAEAAAAAAEDAAPEEDEGDF